MSAARSSEITDSALHRLHDASRKAFKDVSCEFEDGTIVLRGHSSSYYEKQLAQETVRGVEGVAHVDNRIEVTPIRIPAVSGPSHPVHVSLRSCDAGIPDFEFMLAGSRVLIGRAEAADVCIDDQFVSRYHCEIRAINGTLWVRDLGSANGVFVNGFHEIQSYLMPGDRLTIGEIHFRVDYELRSPRSYEDVLP